MNQISPKAKDAYRRACAMEQPLERIRNFTIPGRRSTNRRQSMIENERELFAAIEQFLAAEGEQAALRAHQLVTYALINFRRSAAVQARREALRIVGRRSAPGDGTAQS